MTDGGRERERKESGGSSLVYGEGPPVWKGKSVDHVNKQWSQ